MQKIAFFDVDKTLLRINSGAAWLKYERRGGRLKVGQLVRAGLALAKYSLGGTDIEHTIRAAIASQAGESAAELQARTNHFLELEVLPTIRPQALECMRTHQSQGTLCVLLTTSTQFLAEPLGAYVKADAVLSTRLAIDAAGLLTGQPEEPLCYGDGKVTLAKRYADRVNGSVEQSTFYTDSYSDLPMLLRVGCPVVISPDRRLRRYAHRQEWPIMEWEE